MCFENLKNKHQELLQFLKTENYSDTTIRIVANEITVSIENAEKFGWQTYQDVYHAYESQGLSQSILRSKRHCLRLLKRFDIQGEFPDRTRRSYVFESDVYENLPDEINNPGASTQALCSAPTSPLTALAFCTCFRKRKSGVC